MGKNLAFIKIEYGKEGAGTNIPFQPKGAS